MSEITIRGYREEDAPSAGRLIADTYAEYNLNFLPVEAREPFLGPFRHAGSSDRMHREAIAAVIWTMNSVGIAPTISLPICYASACAKTCLPSLRGPPNSAAPQDNQTRRVSR